MSEIKLDKVISFKRDTAFRKQSFVPNSFSHPAKMDAQLCLWITERYTKPGDVILDPMGGMGTQMLACMIGRNVVLVELEDKFCKMMWDNWEQVRMRPQLGYEMGRCQILQGDARNLEGLLADCVVTSPPYEEAMGKKHHSPIADRIFREKGLGVYTDRADAVVTSPPYEHQIHRNSDEGKVDQIKAINPSNYVEHSQPVIAALYNPSTNNIGNLKGETYLQAMLQVYQQCHKVLKPQGLMILVTKNFIRDRKIIRLDMNTIRLCEQAGFYLFERHYRKLPSQSFWRILYWNKYHIKIDYEDVLAFRRVD